MSTSRCAVMCMWFPSRLRLDVRPRGSDVRPDSFLRRGVDRMLSDRNVVVHPLWRISAHRHRVRTMWHNGELRKARDAWGRAAHRRPAGQHQFDLSKIIPREKKGLRGVVNGKADTQIQDGWHA